MNDVEARLRAAGLALPLVAAPLAAYVPWRLWGGFVFVSGQLPVRDGVVVWRGAVGAELSLEEGISASRLCALHVLACVREACGGDWGRVEGCLRLCGFIHAARGFTEHAQVMNGASGVVVEALGESGRHGRAAVGVASLPLAAAVEVEGLFAVRERAVRAG